ncbi:hypothetical protein KFL_000750360, partial [Klebsormidium nitens]
MAPGTINLFERLPEDLVRNILERVLWRPFEFGITKSRRKVYLGLLCKQFRAAIAALESLEWEIHNAEDEQKFLHFLRGREEGLSLKRLSINVAHVCRVRQGILEAVTLVARETLEEVCLFLGDKDEAVWEDWPSTLSLLQECKNLKVLHVALWAA